MSNYIISHGQFHEVSDDELMHWKYISRQKQNGKWVYTYPSDTNKGKVTTEPKVSKEYQQELAYNSQKNVYPGQKTTSTDTSNKSSSSNNTAPGKKLISNYTKWIEQKKWVDSMAADQAKETIYPKDYEKYREYQKNQNKSVIDKVKDKLGVDERDIYRDAARNKDRADRLAEDSQKKADQALENYNYLDKLGVFEGEHALDREGHWDSYQRKNNVATMDKAYAEAYGKAYTELREEFLNTPLGKLHATGEKIDGWIDEKIGDLEEWWKTSKKARKSNKR